VTVKCALHRRPRSRPAIKNLVFHRHISARPSCDGERELRPNARIAADAVRSAW
jgi:hypothetical protein